MWPEDQESILFRLGGDSVAGPRSQIAAKGEDYNVQTAPLTKWLPLEIRLNFI